MKIRKQTINDLRTVVEILERKPSRELVYGSASCLMEIFESLRVQAGNDFRRSQKQAKPKKEEAA